MSFERRELGGGVRALVSTELGQLGVLAAFSERAGGLSEAPYASLDLSFSVGDDPGRVAGNRERLTGGLEVGPFAVAGLVHGSKIVRIGPKRAGAGYEGPGSAVGGCDGLATASSGLPMLVTTADCVPLVFASSSEKTVAVVHAGWRGMAAGIVSRGAALFARPADVRVAIGPAIGPCHYEVGDDVALAVAAASDAGARTERRGGKLFLDLVGSAKGMLESAGVREVTDTGLCTVCEAERFFSHRRDGTTGRQGALAVRLEGGP